MNQKKLVKDFIEETDLTVISTVDSKNVPESAVILFAKTPQLEFIFYTFPTSRKYKNMKDNPSVSFVIGWDERITVQYVGIAEELQKKDLKKYRDLFFKQNPKAIKWEGKKDIAYFKVTPKWIRYTNLNKDPWQIFEITSF
jgi:pyridoxine/pyridoxamine 5'-phosphate oxidase